MYDFILQLKSKRTKISESPSLKQKLEKCNDFSNLKYFSDSFIDFCTNSEKFDFFLERHKYFCFGKIAFEDRNMILKSLNIDEKNIHKKTSDSKLLFEFFNKFGDKGLSKINRVFSLIIFDYNFRKLVIYRDHVGFKNVYYTEHQQDIFLSSSFKTLKNLHKTRYSANVQKLKNFMKLRDLCMESTFYNEISKIPPATKLIIKKNCFKVKSYTSLEKNNNHFGLEECAQNLKKILKRSVMGNRMKDERKFGFLFSGGLDSSSILSLFKKYKFKNDKIYAYSANFKGIDPELEKQINEEYYQKKILSSDLVEDRSFMGDKLSTLSEIDFYIDIIGQPFFFPNIYISKEGFKKAKKDGVRFVFNGNDGDSVISHGYEYLFELFQNFKYIKLYKEINKISKLRKKSKRFIFKRTILDQLTINNLFSDSFEKHLNILSSPIHSNAIEIQSLLANHFGVEEVYPFYNKELLNFCINIPAKYKLKNGYSRFILREAMKTILPEEIRLRTDKANLGHALTQSFIKKDRDIIEKHLNSPHQKMSEIIDVDKIKGDWELIKISPRKYSTRSNKPSIIFSFIVVNRWLQLNFKEDRLK